MRIVALRVGGRAALMAALMCLQRPAVSKCGETWELTLVEIIPDPEGDTAGSREAQPGGDRAEDTAAPGVDETDAWPITLEFSGDSPGGPVILGEGVSLDLTRISAARASVARACAP